MHIPQLVLTLEGLRASDPEITVQSLVCLVWGCGFERCLSALLHLQSPVGLSIWRGLFED